jgi:carotenoid cleavage dioxygenase-like enzyme
MCASWPQVDTTQPRGQELMAFGQCLYNASACTRPSQTHHFFDSDYLVHQRANATVTLRMFSNRTINTECVNDENLQGRDLGKTCATGHQPHQAARTRASPGRSGRGAQRLP